jgi:hypothetical protein
MIMRRLDRGSCPGVIKPQRGGFSCVKGTGYDDEGQLGLAMYIALEPRCEDVTAEEEGLIE